MFVFVLIHGFGNSEFFPPYWQFYHPDTWKRNHWTSRLVYGVRSLLRLWNGSIDRLLRKPYSIASVVRGFLLAARSFRTGVIGIEIEERYFEIAESA
jgi:hypothetical protein